MIYILFLLAGCAEPTLRNVSTRTNIPVGVLTTTTDGCTVYCFEDNGRRHYFVRCTDGTAATSTAVPYVKSTYDENIPTLEQ